MRTVHAAVHLDGGSHVPQRVRHALEPAAPVQHRADHVALVEAAEAPAKKRGPFKHKIMT